MRPWQMNNVTDMGVIYIYMILIAPVVFDPSILARAISVERQYL
jgi:hypothetical protein